MSLNIQFAVTGDDEFRRRLQEFPKVATKAARMSINDTLRRGRRMLKKEILSQVNLAPSYVNQDRLTEIPARSDNLVGSIVGRRRATSLARFKTKQLYKPAKNGRRKRAGVTVNMKGRQKLMRRAFLKDLKSGTKDSGNVGLVIRLPEGETPSQAYKPKKLYKSGNLWLLYGPSINQMMLADEQGPSMVQELKPKLTSYLNAEFQRQFERLYRG